MKPKLTVVCLAYNHEKFIRQALDSFMMQKTNFPFEVIVHDDASTDKTAEIIREYQQKYPDIIKPIFQTENQYQKRMDPLAYFMADKIKGQYVALCEGDDYWTDENKLQKQVDFLDKHLDFGVCFHPVRVMYEDKSKPNSIFPKHAPFHKKTLCIKDLLKRNFIPTNSVVYRWQSIKEKWPNWIVPGDWFLHLLQASNEKIKYMSDVMAVYRRHDNSVWDGGEKTADFFVCNGFDYIAFYEEMETRFGVNKSKEIAQVFQKTLAAFIWAGEFDKVKLLKEKKPQIFNDVLQQILKSDLIKQERKLKRKRLIWKSIFVLLLIIIFILIVKG